MRSNSGAHDSSVHHEPPIFSLASCSDVVLVIIIIIIIIILVVIFVIVIFLVIKNLSQEAGTLRASCTFVLLAHACFHRLVSVLLVALIDALRLIFFWLRLSLTLTSAFAAIRAFFLFARLLLDVIAFVTTGSALLRLRRSWRFRRARALTSEFPILRFGTVVVPTSVTVSKTLCVTTHYIPRVSIIVLVTVGCIADWLVIGIVAVGLWGASRRATLNPIATSRRSRRWSRRTGARTREFPILRFGAVVVPTSVTVSKTLCITTHYIPRVSIVVLATAVFITYWFVVRIVAVGLWGTSRGATLNPIAIRRWSRWGSGCWGR